jgi:hypothetical protein
MLFRSIDEGYTESTIEIYAPVEWADHTTRSKIKREAFDPIRQAITSRFTELPAGGAS